MIKITIHMNEKGEYNGFLALGHAGSGEEGLDIVCAAASVLLMNTINAIEMYAPDHTSYVSNDIEGMIDYRIDGRPSKEASLLMKTMILGLESIEDDENYNEFIDLIFEEV